MITISELKIEDFKEIKYVKNNEWVLTHSLFTVKQEKEHTLINFQNEEDVLLVDDTYYFYNKKFVINYFFLKKEIYVFLKRINSYNKIYFKILKIEFRDFELKKEEKILKIKNQTLEVVNFEKYNYRQINYKTKSDKTISLEQKDYVNQINHKKKSFLKKQNLIDSITKNISQLKINALKKYKTLECREIKIAGDDLKNGTGSILSKFE
ncbi:MAG: hypothetical protein ACRCW9_06195 [Cetobacterium sp.]